MTGSDRLGDIGRRLKAAREEIGLPQRRFAEQAGLAPNTYNQWEKGRRLPDVIGAAHLCDAFGITLDWIYRGDASGLPVRFAGILLRVPEK